MPHQPRIDWSSEFVVLEVNAPVTELLLLLTDDGPYYIVLRRSPDLLYVFVAGELARLPSIKQFRFVEPQPGATILDQLDLHEPDSSHLSGLDGIPRVHPYDLTPGRKSQPSRARFVALDANAEPIAVGEDAANVALGGDRQPKTVDLSAASTERAAVEPRWLNAGIPGHPAAAPLALGDPYVAQLPDGSLTNSVAPPPDGHLMASVTERDAVLSSKTNPKGASLSHRG